MVSFWKLQQIIKEEEEAALLDSGEESKAMRVVRTGVGLRSGKDCGSFWDDFISVCNDSEGLSELLDVPAEKIGNWASKVKEVLDKISGNDDQKGSEKKATMMTTGGTPDSGVAEAPPSQEPDMRPTP